MSHNVETMAYAGEVPWHGLGVSVSNDLTPQQMLEKAGLDWTVQKHSLSTKVKGQHIKSPLKALIRSSDSSILTHVGEGWNPVQNHEAFDFFHEFVLAGDMEMHTAGSLKNGQMVWGLAKVKESFDLFGGDQVDSYLLFSNPHMYGKSIDIRFTPIRVVCNNTLTMSLNSHSKNSVKVGHRREFNASEVKETMGIASEKFSKYREMAEFLGSKRVTGDALIEYFNSVFPRTSGSRKVEKVEDLSRNAYACYDALEKQPGAEFAEGSFWQAFNAVTYVTDHIQGREDDGRLYNQWFGQNQVRKEKAMAKAIKMAEAA
jgi:phage/plasmid-like protein (TIGR03299 family)